LGSFIGLALSTLVRDAGELGHWRRWEEPTA